MSDSPSRPDFRSRSGGVLLVVLGTVALVLMIALLASATFQARMALARDAMARESARDTLLLAVSNAVDVLLADTNGVDSLDEPWADPATFFPERSPFRARLRDEGSLLPLATADAAVLAAVFRGAEGEEGMTAEALAGEAEALVRWRDDWSLRHDGEFPPSFAFYADALGGRPALAERLRRCGTASGGGAVNVNTAGPEVLEAVLAASGAGEAGAREMARTALAARKGGAVVETVTRRTLAALFLGEGRMPTTEQAKVLSEAGSRLGASSGRFRGRFECVKPVVAVEFVYDRTAKRFVEWREEP